MSHADHNPCSLAVLCQREVLVMFRSQGNVLDQPLCRFLVHLKLLHRRLGNGFRRLSSLVIHIQVRSLKMDPQHLGSLIPFSHHFSHIGHCFCENIRHLGHRSRKDTRNALLGNPPHPVPKALWLPIVGVKSISAMSVDINKSRHDPLAPIILIRRLCPIWVYGLDLPLQDL